MGKGKMIESHFRVLLVRHRDTKDWAIVHNPKWDLFTESMNNILFNSANKYAEYENCGMVTRMVRYRDCLFTYGFDHKYIKPEYTLNPIDSSVYKKVEV